MKALAAVIALILALMAPPLAAAQTAGAPAHAQRLDQLFAELKAAKSEAEGLALEEQIVSLWLQSGDATIDEKMEWGVVAMDTGSFDLALGYFNSIILNKPDFAEGWNKRATLYYIMGKYQESLDDIAKTLALEPRHFGALAGKGLVMLELGQEEQAVLAFKQALAVDPQLTQIQLQMFLLEDKLKRNRI